MVEKLTFQRKGISPFVLETWKSEQCLSFMVSSSTVCTFAPLSFDTCVFVLCMLDISQVTIQAMFYLGID
jgi:hypothetical protein